MKISRLDKITENNVTYSTQKKTDEQMLYVLQDISSTLAMIYDKMTGNDSKEENYVIPYEDLKNFETMHFESVDFHEGYAVSYIREEAVSTNDIFAEEPSMKVYAVLSAFGENMKLNKKDYNRTWRCWAHVPTVEERENEKWKK